MKNSREKLSFTHALGKTFNEFSKNSSLHGFQYLTPRSDRTLLERCIWWILQLIAIYCVVYLALFSWNEFMEDPTVTTLENPNYAVTNIQFPGISICNLNKISRKRAVAYAKMLAKRSNHSEKEMLDLVLHFGKMYDFGSVKSEEILVEFQAVLDEHGSTNVSRPFSPHRTLRELTQPCTELISNCIWSGVKYNCEDLFVFETTMEGFCCVFNYIAPQQLTQSIAPIIKANKNRTLYPKGSGVDGGLTVTVHPDVDDYLYPLISSVGANVRVHTERLKYTKPMVHIFNSDDFPDTASGSLQERLVTVGIEMFIRLFATYIYAVQEVKKYPVNQRHCKFREEAFTLFGTKYSYSDCILDCRLKSMLALCQCVPFTFIKAIQGPPLPQCTFVDIPCMNRYREKWRRLYPLNYDGDEMDTDKQDSLNCNDCIPTCSNTLYTVRNDFAYLIAPSNETVNYSIVNIFFELDDAKLYKQDVVFYWFEIVSSFGGTCSLMLGLSLISIVEFLYYFTVVLYKNYN